MSAVNRKKMYSNWANIITLFRLGLSIVYIVFVHLTVHSFHNGKTLTVSLCCVLLICLSDFCDGKVARALKTESAFGQYFDVSVDLFYVFTSHLQMAIYGIIPVWFLLVIIERITNYIYTSYAYGKNSKSNHFFVKDTVGKYVAAAFFVTPFVVYVLHTMGESGIRMGKVILWTLTLGSLISTVTRIYQVTAYKRG